VNWGQTPFNFRHEYLSKYLDSATVPQITFPEARQALAPNGHMIAPIQKLGASTKQGHNAIWKRISSALESLASPQKPGQIPAGNPVGPNPQNPPAPTPHPSNGQTQVHQIPTQGNQIPIQVNPISIQVNQIPIQVNPKTEPVLPPASPSPSLGTSFMTALPTKLPEGLSYNIITWKAEDVCRWLVSLRLSQDYSALITSGGIDGEVLLNDLKTPEDLKEVGIKAFGDVRKILRAKTMVVEQSAAQALAGLPGFN